MADGDDRAEVNYQARIDELEESVTHYILLAGQAWAAAEEQRNRRLEIEEELAVGQVAFREREPQIKFIERKVYQPMPAREVVKRIYVDRTVKIIEWQERPAGFFGRIADRLDRIFGT